MCLNPEFYKHFRKYDYILICQTDAIVLGTEEELLRFTDMGFDYYGAPWLSTDKNKSDGYWFARHTFPERFIDYVGRVTGIRDKIIVGNGGFSLRKVASTIELLDKYQDFIGRWFEGEHEDNIFSFLSQLEKKQYVVCPVGVAKQFATDGNAKETSGIKPFGRHAANMIL